MTWPLLPTTGVFESESFPDSGARKRSALKRLRIYQEDFKTDIATRILETHNDSTVQNRIMPFISVTINPARDVTQAVAISYDLGVRRVLRGATEEQQLAFAGLIDESQATTKAPIWNRYAFFLGPTIVIPCIRKGKIFLDILRPDTTDIVLDYEDPSTPSKAVWQVTGTDVNYVMLDSEKWLYLDEKGFQIKEPSYHNLGYFPGTVFRLDEPIDDFWPRNYQERLVDATITCAFTYTKMQWVRKSQNKKLLTIIGNTEDIPKGQVLDPELSLMVSSQVVNATTVQVIDFETSPQAFLDEIKFTFENIIESYGINQGAVTWDVNSEAGALSNTIRKERLGHIREAQIPYLTRAEMDLWPKVVAIAQAANHPLAMKLPSPEEISQMLEIQWPVMRTIDDPIQREELYKARLKRGGVSPIDMLQEDNPKLTRAECQALMNQNLSEQAALIEEFTKRNLVMDLSSGLIASSEAMGKLGPMIRDANKSSQSPQSPQMMDHPMDPSQMDQPIDKMTMK